ncbi:hypothetical protein BGZ79_009169 [Entomortierella chlamydospora]|nr:hypothetical protein BGZ79_009169 [Entomortierella chlamydospora]
MATGDIVTSESTFFWKLTIEPTRFSNSFCESITRYFESEPEPSSLQDYHWKLSFAEHMINGTASVDIEIWRIRVSSSQGQQQDRNNTKLQNSELDAEERQSLANEGDNVQISELLFQQITPTPVLSSKRVAERESNIQQTHEESLQKAPSQDISPRIRQISYKTIAIHAPTKLTPIISMFLNNTGGCGTPFRDASDILYRGAYEFEIVLSEESYLVPSPSSYHRALDSMFHKVVATSLPDPMTANIWFEFHNSDEEESMGGGTTVVGAHEQVLTRCKYFAEWVKRERQTQEELRRKQLEDERRIHDQQQQFQWRERGHRPKVMSRRDATRFEQPLGDFIPEQQQQPQRLWSSSSSSFLCQQEDLSHQHYAPVCASVQIEEVNRNSSFDSIHPHQRAQPLQYPHQPLPALRIPVKAMSLETFQVLLQYLYTGRINISEQQENEINVYDCASSEVYHVLREESISGLTTHHLDSRHEGKTWETESSDANLILPPLRPPKIREMDACVGFDDEVWSSLTALLQENHNQHDNRISTTSTLSSFHSSWLSCSSRNLSLHSHVQQNITHPQGYYDHTKKPKQPRRRPGCTWEDLLEVSMICDLPDLGELAMKAVQYHCQMLTIRSFINNNLLSDVPHNAFDETRLDLQLALSGHILQEFLKLYDVSSSGGGYKRFMVGTERGSEGQREAENPISKDRVILCKEHNLRGSRELTDAKMICESRTSNRNQLQQLLQRGSQLDSTRSPKILFDEPECDEALTELCTEICKKFLIVRGSHE